MNTQDRKHEMSKVNPSVQNIILRTSMPPMQKRTTRTSINQNDMSLYSMTRKHEANTTNRSADTMVISSTPLEPVFWI